MSQSEHHGTAVYATQCDVHIWRTLTSLDENLSLLSIYSNREFDVAIPRLSAYSHVVRSLDPNRIIFVTLQRSEEDSYTTTHSENSTETAFLFDAV